MVYRNVNLGKEIPVGVLEKILLDAAADVGWKASVNDYYTTEYRLGSLHHEERYRWTDVNLKGSFLPLAKIDFYKDRSTNDHISLYYGFGEGFSTTREIERYLLAVSKRVETFNKPDTSPKVLAGTV